MMKGKHVLITGGAGSFGRHFIARALSSSVGPRLITVYSRDPHKHDEMRRMFPGEPIRYVIGCVRDASALAEAAKGVDVMIHAAALKHVDQIEDYPQEAIATNIHGTRNAIGAALAAGVERFVFLSTDKAVAPANVYGSTKHIGETLTIIANRRRPAFTVVRYGNVMSSKGSVLPYWVSLTRSGESTLPVTDEWMTRFWLSYDEAAHAVWLATQVDPGTTVVHKAPSFRVVDLAETLGCGVRIIGRRPGEKLHECLIHDGEKARCTDRGEYIELAPAVDIGVPCEQPTGIPAAYTSDLNSTWLDHEALQGRVAELVKAGDL